MSDFESLWHFITHRDYNVIVQEKSELEHIYTLATRCRSYLEVGTAEGNSLYVLSKALSLASSVTYVDIGEPHTEKPRKEIVKLLEDGGLYVNEIVGNSHLRENIREAYSLAPYDMVMIDADHDYSSVIADAIAYGPMARKFIVFHDIKLPDVQRAFDWYVYSQSFKRYYTFCNSENFGYGIIEV